MLKQFWPIFSYIISGKDSLLSSYSKQNAIYPKVMATMSCDIWNLNWYLLKRNGCFKSYVTMWHENENCWWQSDCPAYSLVRELRTVISSISPAWRGTKLEWLWSERLCITPLIPEGGGDPRVSNNWCIILYGDFPKRLMMIWKSQRKKRKYY